MRSKVVTTFVYLIIAVAAFGLFSQLFGNTVAFLSRLLISVVIGAAIFGLIYFFLMRKQPAGRRTDNMKKYKQAVKQSKSKYSQHKATKTTSYQQTKQKKRNPKRASHLRVIDGSKAKKKNRVSS